MIELRVGIGYADSVELSALLIQKRIEYNERHRGETTELKVTVDMSLMWSSLMISSGNRVFWKKAAPKNERARNIHEAFEFLESEKMKLRLLL